ncbi:MAG: hypothetical protein IJU38_06980 [Clostridia bacterium]|nr:hypothetical protein [Clostridia bacterium]
MNYAFTENTLSALDRLQKDLRDLIESLQDSGSRIQDSGAPQAQSGTQGTVPAVPEAGQTRTVPMSLPTLEEVRKVLVEKARAGKNEAVRDLLNRFHAASLPEVDPADYADLLELGRKL